MDFQFGFSIVALVIAFSSPLVARGEFQLGPPPVAPTQVVFVPHLDSLRTGGFTVDTASREQTRSFYNAVYPTSDGVPMGSTANVANCVAGTTSADFSDAVVRRINWYRAMAGVPANVILDPTFSAKDLAGALMMSANSQLSHFPPPDWNCWSSDGTNAAANSNLALGSAGPDAVDGYIQDPGPNNDFVGHRRWLFYPQTQLMGTGDVPEQDPSLAANAIWVVDGHFFDPRPPTRSPYVAWPPTGYMPYQITVPRWSFSFPQATFTTATVTMTSNGVPIVVDRMQPSNGYGDNTLVWVPMGLDPNSQTMTWPFNGQDTVYSVSISNVLVASQITNFNYTVTVFDPALPGSDYTPLTISGPTQPAVGQNNQYSFSAVANATGYQWRYSRRLAFNLFDGAEGGLINFIAGISPGYSVIASNPVSSGTHSFQLAHLTPEPQWLSLIYALTPRTNGLLQFRSRLGVATPDQVARVQFSTNDGAFWFDAYSQPGNGVPGESSFSTRNISLGAYAGATLAVRFNYDFNFGSYYTNVGANYGWHLDNILITNVDQLLPAVTNAVPAPSFQFNPPAVGAYDLQARAVLFNDFPLDWGPAKTVSSVIGAPVVTIVKLELINGQVSIPFTVQSASGARLNFKLLYASQIGGAWQIDSAASLTTNVPGASYRFMTATGGAVRFYQVQGQ